MDINSSPIEQTHHETPSRRWWPWLAIVGVLLILGGVWIILSPVLGSGGGETPGELALLEPAPVPGHPAPDFALKNLAGDTIRLSDFKGKAVIVNFWATWCPPCRAEFPEMQEAAIENKDDLVIIGVNHTSGDTPALIPGFVDEFGITFPIVLDETGETVKTYGVLGLPTSVFVDKNGIVQEVFTGIINRAYIETKLSEL
jgi:peroxiredoxin